MITMTMMKIVILRRSNYYACAGSNKIHLSLMNHFTNLRVLSLKNYNILTNNNLYNLENLENLSLHNCKLTELSFMKYATNLRSLVLNRVYNKDPLEDGPSSELDFNPLQYLYNLETINITYTYDNIIPSLLMIPNLATLYIDGEKYTEDLIKKINPSMCLFELQEYLDKIKKQNHEQKIEKEAMYLQNLFE